MSDWRIYLESVGQCQDYVSKETLAAIGATAREHVRSAVQECIENEIDPSAVDDMVTDLYHIARLLENEFDDELDSLREHADALREEEPEESDDRDWDDGDYEPDVISDEELDDMFGRLS